MQRPTDAGGTSDAAGERGNGQVRGKRPRLQVIQSHELADPNGPAEPPLSDVGRAERLARAIVTGQSHFYVAEERRWYTWAGTHWEPDELGTVTRLAIELAKAHPEGRRDAGLTRAGVNAAVDLARATDGVTVSVRELDAHPFLLNTQSGTVDLRTGALHRHDPDDRLTICTPSGFDPDTERGTWDRFLSTTFGGDPGLIAYVQRIVGSAAIGELREQRLIVAYGGGDNGKSTLWGVVQHLLGRYATTLDATLLASTDKRSSASRDYKAAELKGKRLACAFETGAGAVLDEATVKMLCSTDEFLARNPYGRPFTVTPTHTLVLSTNHRPVVTTQDDGTWRRLTIIPFLHRIPAESKDRDLPQKLRAEGDGILAWIVSGAVAYLREGLGSCAAADAATAAYRRDSDTVGQFLTDCCTIGPGARANQALFYEAWRDWCHAQGQAAWRLKALKETLRERGVLGPDSEVKSNGTRWLLGVALSENVEAAMTRHTTL
jgi:putative DNA primase/helicase